MKSSSKQHTSSDIDKVIGIARNYPKMSIPKKLLINWLEKKKNADYKISFP